MGVPAQPRLILVEGIPSSGKTTVAGWIRSWLDERGVPALWSPEEQRDHPAIDRPTMRFCRESDFASRCVARWQAFATACESARESPVHIFDACFFQNTARFLLEHEHAEGEPARYLKKTEQAIDGLAPRLVYLEQRDPRAFLEAQTVSRKGREIVGKVAAYTETTAYAKRRTSPASRA